jgi:hypothetical protein
VQTISDDQKRRFRKVREGGRKRDGKQVLQLVEFAARTTDAGVVSRAAL